MKRSKTKSHQFELAHSVSGTFSLAGEQGEDPLRVILERGRELGRLEQAREYERSMQLLLNKCPGLLGADAPSSEASLGKVVIDPRLVGQACAWLKRRFHVNEEIRLSQDAGLCLEIRPRPRRTSRHGPRKVSFRKPEQFQLFSEGQLNIS